jgi:hypothetical protein
MFVEHSGSKFASANVITNERNRSCLSRISFVDISDRAHHGRNGLAANQLVTLVEPYVRVDDLMGCGRLRRMDNGLPAAAAGSGNQPLVQTVLLCLGLIELPQSQAEWRRFCMIKISSRQYWWKTHIGQSVSGRWCTQAVLSKIAPLSTRKLKCHSMLTSLLITLHAGAYHQRDRLTICKTPTSLPARCPAVLHLNPFHFAPLLSRGCYVAMGRLQGFRIAQRVLAIHPV